MITNTAAQSEQSNVKTQAYMRTSYMKPSVRSSASAESTSIFSVCKTRVATVASSARRAQELGKQIRENTSTHVLRVLEQIRVKPLAGASLD